MKTNELESTGAGALPRSSELPATLQAYLKGIGETPLLNQADEKRFPVEFVVGKPKLVI